MRQMTSPHRAVGSKHCGCAPPSLSQAAAVTAHYDGVRFSRCVQFVTSGCKFSTEKRNLQICRNHNFPTSTPLRVQKKSHFSSFSFLISHFEFTGACACYIIYIYLPSFLPPKNNCPPKAVRTCAKPTDFCLGWICTNQAVCAREM